MTAQKKTWEHKPRVASFTCKTEKGKRIFTPVNARAQRLARKCGKRTRLTTADLKQFKGYFKLRQYQGGKLASVKV